MSRARALVARGGIFETIRVNSSLRPSFMCTQSAMNWRKGKRGERVHLSESGTDTREEREAREEIEEASQMAPSPPEHRDDTHDLGHTPRSE